MKEMKHWLFLLLVIYGIINAKDVMSDMQTVATIKSGLNHTYNYEFEEAEKYFLKIKQSYPTHPAYHLLEAIKINMENPNMIPGTSGAYTRLSLHLNKAIEFSNVLLKVNPKNFEAIFFKMNALSLFGLKHSEAKEYGKAMNYAQQTYDYVKIALKHKASFKEFYFTSGLYNFYSIQYPETHPVIKPFMLFFQKGDKLMGLIDLEYASKNTAFSETEAYYFLSNIHFKYQNKIQLAYSYQKLITSRHPKNSFYQYKLAEIALELNDTKQALICLDSIAKNKRPFYQAVYWTITGIYQLKTNYSNSKTKASFLQALKICETNGIKSTELNTLIYLGLARSYAVDKNTAMAVKNYKICKENTSNNYYIKEINDYLKSVE